MTKEYLMVRNWERWQSYRGDRGQPPWIKLHRNVMRNPEWVSLTDAQRGQLVVIWLLAADRDGVIPASPRLVQKLCFMDDLPDLDTFIALGFIEPDAIMTPSRRQCDAPEERREEENRKEKRGKGAPPGSHPSDAQMRTMREMADERGLKFGDVLGHLGLEEVRSENVTAIMSHLKAAPKPKAEDVATEAKNAALRQAKQHMDQLLLVDDLDFALVREFVEEQSPELVTALRIHLKSKLESRGAA